MLWTPPTYPQGKSYPSSYPVLFVWSEIKQVLKLETSFEYKKKNMEFHKFTSIGYNYAGSDIIPGKITNKRNLIMKKIVLSLLVVFAVTILFYSCGGGGSDTGTLRVNLTDASGNTFSAINVTITHLFVHQSSTANSTDAGWIEIPVTASMPVKLLSLQNGVVMTLGETTLGPGHYQQIRLVIQPNTGSNPPFNDSVMPVGGAEQPLDVPSNEIKLINEFQVNTGSRTDVLLDFDGKNSVILTGNGTYILQPVINVQTVTIN